jgi:hypothetical protein
VGLCVVVLLICGKIIVSVFGHPPFMVTPVQAQGIIHNSLHMSVTVAAYVSCHMECTSTVLLALFRTDCCPCVIVNPDNF